MKQSTRFFAFLAVAFLITAGVRGSDSESWDRIQNSVQDSLLKDAEIYLNMKTPESTRAVYYYYWNVIRKNPDTPQAAKAREGLKKMGERCPTPEEEQNFRKDKERFQEQWRSLKEEMKKGPLKLPKNPKLLRDPYRPSPDERFVTPPGQPRPANTKHC